MWLLVSAALGGEPLVALAEASCGSDDTAIARARAEAEATPDRPHLEDLSRLVSACVAACVTRPDCPQRDGPSGEIGATLDWLLARAAPGVDAFRDPAAWGADQLLKSWFFRGAAALPVSEIGPIRGSSACPPREGPCEFKHVYAWGPDWRVFTWRSGGYAGEEIWHRVNGAWTLRFASSGYV